MNHISLRFPPPLASLLCGIVATFSCARAGNIAQSVAFPVINQAVSLTVSADLLGIPISVAGPLGNSELTPNAQGLVVWTPARYGKYTLTCGDATNAIWVTTRPMKFHWWNCTTAQKNVTEVMQNDAAWQARGVTRVDWTGGDYLAQSPDNPNGYTTAQQWYNNWTYAYNKDGMALDEMWCDAVPRTNAMLDAITMVRQARGPTYSINVWSAGFGSNFAAGATNFKTNKVTVLIEDYYGVWSNHKSRWDAVRNYGLQNQAISGIWPGNTNLLTEAQIRADVALVRLAGPEANGIAMFAPIATNYTPNNMATLLDDCDRAIEDYYLKPLIHLSVNSSAELIVWNLGNEDATGFSLQLLNGTGGVLQTIDLSALAANGKQNLAIPIGAITAKVINPPNTANLYTGNSQYSNGIYPLLVPGRYTWIKAIPDQSWSTGSNWNPAGPPPGGIDGGNYAYFDGTVSAATSLNAPAGEISINNVQFATAGWTINGNATSQYFYTYGISSVGAGTNTINTGISSRAAVFASFTVGSGNSLVMNGRIGAGGGDRNTGGLNKNGSGTLTTTYANNYTGATNVNGGKLSVRNMSSWVSTPVSIASGASLDIDLGSATQNPAGATVFSGAGLLTFSSGYIKMGPNGANLVNLQAGGQLDVQGGKFEIGWARNTMGGNLGSMNVASGAFYYNSDAAASVDALTGSGVIANAYNSNVFALTVGVSGTRNNAAYGVSGNTATYLGVIRDQESYNGVTTANTSLTKTGTGTQILSGANTYHGPTTINGGTLQIAGSGKLGGGSYAGAISNSGTFEYASSANQTLGGIISGAGTLKLSGPGILSLSVTNTYNGPTIINGGTLNVTGSISNSTVTINSGGSLAGSGTTGAVTVAAGGTIAPGVAGVGSLNLNNKVLSLSGATNLAINASNGVINGIVNASAVTYGGTLKVTNLAGTFTANQVFTLFSAGTYSGSFSTIKLPALPAGLYWDTTNLAVNGKISVSTTGTQVLTSVELTPAAANLGSGAIQQFGAVTCDQYGNPMPSQPNFIWSLAGSGTLNGSGFYAALYTPGVATVTATSGAYNGTANITVTNAAPTVPTAAAASPSAVNGLTTSLSVLGADTDGGGEPNLIYTWVATSIPSGATAPVFSQNGTNAAKTTTATFSNAGSYTFRCTITDLGGASTNSSVNVSVIPKTDLITLTPATASLPSGATLQLTADATDQFGTSLNNSAVTWTVTSGIGSVSAQGLYTAPIGSTGNVTVQASASGVSGTAAITVTPVVNAVWINPAGGSWIGSTNWEGGGIPFGDGVTADFSTLTLTANATVTLDGTKTVGNLKFDAPAPYGWILNAGSGGSLALSAAGATPVIQVNNQTASIGAVISGNQGFVKTGIGTLILSGNNSYSGATTVDGGTLVFSKTSTSQPGPTAFTVNAGGTLQINNTGSVWDGFDRDLTINGGAASLGGSADVVYYSASNINMTGGTLTFSSKWRPYGNFHVTSKASPATATISGTASYLYNPALNFDVERGTAASDLDVSLALRGSGSLTKDGAGTLTFTNSNTFTGGVSIKAGALHIGGAGTLGNGTYAGAIMNNGAMDYASTANQIFSGVISGTGTLTHAGTGRLTLSGNNSYSGATTVNGGKLVVNGSLGSTIATTVASAGSLGGTGSLAGAVTLNGTLDPGSNGIGNLTIGNALTLAGGSRVEWEISGWTGTAGTGWDKTTVASLNLTASAENPITIRPKDIALANFTEAGTSFVFVETTTGITGFSADQFTVDTSGLTLPKGTWAVQQAGNHLVLAYTAAVVPDANANDILDAWEITNFGNADTGANAANADADLDGICNLMEYAFDSNPLASNPSLQNVDLETREDGQFLRLTVPKNPAATNLIYIVESGGALNDWSTATTEIEWNSDTELIVRDTVPVGSEPSRYIRLRVQTAE